jgi:hypothetical protein
VTRGVEKVVDTKWKGRVNLQRASPKTPHELKDISNTSLENTRYTVNVTGQMKQDIYYVLPKEVDHCAGLGKCL